jgi:hypothetical protein
MVLTTEKGDTVALTMASFRRSNAIIHVIDVVLPN